MDPSQQSDENLFRDSIKYLNIKFEKQEEMETYIDLEKQKFYDNLNKA